MPVLAYGVIVVIIIIIIPTLIIRTTSEFGESSDVYGPQ